MSYIHELPDWPNFRYDAASLLGPLAQVMERRGFLIGRLEALGIGELQNAKVEALSTEALKSSEIEGERLVYEDVRSSIARRLGLETGGVPVGDRRAEGVSEIAIDASDNWRDPLTTDRLFQWHRRLFPDERGPHGHVSVGAWRSESSGQMLVVSGPIGHERIHFEAPMADRMDPEMTEFLSWFDKSGEMNGILRAALAHLWFVTIHPFEDGNGRVGRAILELALAQSDRRDWRCYSVSEQILKERQAYYDALQHAQSGTVDVTAWIDWFMGCLSRALETAGSRVSAVPSRDQFWRFHADKNLNDRQRKVIMRMLIDWEGKMTSKKWQKLTGATPKTATRDMVELVEMGIFLRDEGSTRNVSYQLQRNSEPSERSNGREQNALKI